MRKAADLVEEKGVSGAMGVAAAWFHLLNTEEEGSLQSADELITNLWHEKDKVLPKCGLFLARSTLKNLQRKYEDSL